MNRPQHEITVHPGLLPDEYREVVAHRGGEVLDLGHRGVTLNPLPPGGHELVADDPTSAGDPR